MLARKSNDADTDADEVSSCFQQQTDDVETLFEGMAGEGWEFEPVQLTSGLLGSSYTMVQLREIAIYWSHFEASLHMRECQQLDAVYLAFLVDGSGPAKYYGRELGSEYALMYLPRHEQDYVLPCKSRTLGFMINGSLLRSMGWNLNQIPVNKLARKKMDDIVVLAENITRQLRSNKNQNDENLLVLQERLMMQLGELLAPWMKITASEYRQEQSLHKHYRLIEKARRYMMAHDPVTRLSISKLALHLGTSPRTLYRAFTRYLGVGPYEYYTLMKMQAFRQTIRSSGQYHGAITEAAFLNGFTHLGRFSKQYREFYDELPRDTYHRFCASAI